MREPAFWWRPASPDRSCWRRSRALYGAVAAHRLRRNGARRRHARDLRRQLSRRRRRQDADRARAGKLLRELGETPVVLSRGYRGTLRGPVRVDPHGTAPPMSATSRCCLRAALPVVVSRDRVDGAALAAIAGASVIVMDDGFQNPSLAKDCSLIVIDGVRGIGNGR